MGYLKSFFRFFFVVLLLSIVSFSTFIFYWLHKPLLEKNVYTDYYVSKGSSFSKIAYDLSKEKIISFPKLFILYSNFLNMTHTIKYGTYHFTDNDYPISILNKLVSGDTVLMKVTLPEGLNIYQMAEKLEGYFPSIHKDQWLHYFAEPSLIQILELKASLQNIEGFLFPETYFFDPHPDPEFMVKNILTMFKKNVTSALFDKAKAMGLSPIQFITLASIIEKETSIESERKMVAGVYWNRIKKHMKLQADPTVIYGIWPRYNGSLTKKDLVTPTPYNTYTMYGLPPGPIANPGLNSILATLEPAKTEAIFFVATGHGGHIFTKTLKEHNMAVRNYIRYLRSKH